MSYFWNINAATMFSYALGGTVMTRFEADFDAYRSGAEDER